MFGHKKKRGPTQPFTHADDCKIAKADPDVQIEWSEVETGHWEAICACGHEYFHEPPADDRVRLSPYDPATARHLGQCEYVAETDPSVLRVLLKVKPGLGVGYDWVECGGCGAGWQVPHYAESIARRRVDGWGSRIPSPRID